MSTSPLAVTCIRAHPYISCFSAPPWNRKSMYLSAALNVVSIPRPENEYHMSADFVAFPAAVPHMPSCGAPCAKEFRGPVAQKRNSVPNFPGFEDRATAAHALI